jgi:hypothetical protein
LTGDTNRNFFKEKYREIHVLESDVYGPLANWMKTHFGLDWAKTTHENACIIFNDDSEIRGQIMPFASNSTTITADVVKPTIK